MTARADVSTRCACGYARVSRLACGAGRRARKPPVLVVRHRVLLHPGRGPGSGASCSHLGEEVVVEDQHASPHSRRARSSPVRFFWSQLSPRLSPVELGFDVDVVGSRRRPSSSRSTRGSRSATGSRALASARPRLGQRPRDDGGVILEEASVGTLRWRCLASVERVSARTSDRQGVNTQRASTGLCDTKDGAPAHWTTPEGARPLD